MKKKNWFLSLYITILLLLIFFAPSYGWRVRQWLGETHEPPIDPNGLASENIVLKAQLAELQVVQSQLPVAPSGTIRAMVYSRYPMNFRNELLVNAGAQSGVTAGKAVFFGTTLIGKVEKVFKDTALVQTVFDGDFKMPVRVGSAGYDALLTGGTEPKAGSIIKTAAVKSGDVIISADPAFPYGAPIGTVRDVAVSADNLFEEATVDFPYDINSIQTVAIEK